MNVSINLTRLCILHIFLASSLPLVRSQEAGVIDTLIYFANQNVDINGIAVTGDVDSVAVYFDVDSTFIDYNILELQILLNPNIGSLKGELVLHKNKDSKRPGVILKSIRFMAEGAEDFYPNWLKIDLRDTTVTNSMVGDFWLSGHDLLSTVVSETSSGHTFLHRLTVQRWDSIRYDFAVKAIVEQNKPTAVRNGERQPNYNGLTFQNYPNPFHQETVIRLETTAPKTISVSIFDISGRLVRKITPGETVSRERAIVWDGKDEQGFSVSSGIYFCRIIRFGQNEITTGKMLLVR
jgi:hypothetical protein